MTISTGMIDTSRLLSTFLGTLNYYLIAGLLYFFLFYLWRNKLKKYCIQPDKKIEFKQIRKEMKNSSFAFVVYHLSGSLFLILYGAGYTKINPDFSASDPLTTFFGVMILIVWTDAWFYFTHRLLHTNWLYEKVHYVHHQSVVTTAFTAYSFHPVEAAILASATLPVVIFVPLNIQALLIYNVFASLKVVENHLGYDFVPKTFLSHWLASSTDHNIHHTTYSQNYAVYFSWWDRIFKTKSS